MHIKNPEWSKTYDLRENKTKFFPKNILVADRGLTPPPPFTDMSATIRFFYAFL